MTEFRPPRAGEEGRLRALWRQAFQESEAFIDLFFARGYSPERCMVASEEGIEAMLYWFDCALDGQKIAYLYGVATDEGCRGRGIASRLMAAVEAHLEERGYDGVILVPAGESLFRFYGRLGYRTCGFMREEIVPAGVPIPIRELSAGEFAAERRKLLPPGAVIQEGANLALLSGYGRFLAGDGWCAVYVPGERTVIAEFLGEDTATPGLIAALGIEKALVRKPGGEKPFVMGKCFRGEDIPRLWFAFAFD